MDGEDDVELLRLGVFWKYTPNRRKDVAFTSVSLRLGVY